LHEAGIDHQIMGYREKDESKQPVGKEKQKSPVLQDGQVRASRYSDTSCCRTGKTCIKIAVTLSRCIPHRIG
jgi:hypothetical protein